MDDIVDEVNRLLIIVLVLVDETWFPPALVGIGHNHRRHHDCVDHSPSGG